MSLQRESKIRRATASLHSKLPNLFEVCAAATFSVRDLKSESPNQCGNGQLAIGKCLEVHLRISQLRSERGALPNCAICSVDSRLGLEFDHGSHVLESHLAECDGPSTIS